MQGRLKKLVAGVLFAVMISGSILPETVYANEEGYEENQGSDQIVSNGESQDGSEEANQVQTDQEQGDESGSDNTDDTDTTDTIELDNQGEALSQEETDNSVNTSESETETGDNGELAAVGAVEFVYIESPYLETPNTQRIVFAFDSVSNDIESMTITVEDKYGSQEDWQSAKQKDGLFLFEKNYDGEAYTGTYRVISINIDVQGQMEVLNLSDMDIEAQFGVNEEYVGYEELQPLGEETAEQSEELGATVVTIDENGGTEAQDSIADALNVVSAETASANSLTKSAANVSSRLGNIVVALDPGHDSRSTGASGNGLREEELTLKIANYCKEELEQYAGVEVYMTRTGADCPYNMSGAGCIEYRVKDAAAAGAQIYVSFHLNSSTSSSVSGAEIIVQNNNWRPEVAAESQALAREILDELVALGLNERDIYWRNSESGSTYSDGSLADYFSVQRNCKLYNIPGIIVEHAFISNSGDANSFLKTETGLKSLGVADATGIAQYLGLAKIGDRVDLKEGTYTLNTALVSNKSIGVPDSSWESGVPIALYDTDINKSSQRFEIISTGDGYYNIIAEHSGKALEVKEGSAASGVTIQQNTLNRNSQAQKWCFYNAGNGQYYIASALGTYMDVFSALTSEGTQVWAYAFNGSLAQTWELKASDYHPVENGTYTIRNGLNTGMVLSIESGSTQDYGNVCLLEDNDASEQRFEISYVGGGYYKIIAEHSGKSLDVFSALTAPETNLQQYTWNGSDAQLWKFVDAGNGTYYIRSKLGTVIDLESGQAVSEVNVCMDNMNGDESQKWLLSEDDYRPVEDGQYVITNSGSPYNVIGVSGEITEIHTYTGADSQLFEITYIDHGYYRITSIATGKVLDVKDASTSAGAKLWTYTWNGSDAQLWKFILNDDGSYQIRSKLGTVIDISSGIIASGTSLQMYTWNESNAQKWIMEKDKGEVNLQPIADGTYTISNSSDNNQVLDINSALESNGAKVQTYRSNDTSAQRFELSYVGDGYYRITAEHSGKVLDVPNASRADGVNIWQYAWNNSDAQLWRILDAGNGTYYIQSKLGTVLDIANDTAVSGTSVETDYMSTSDTQKWTFAESEYRPIEDGLYSLRSAAHLEYTIDIANASKNNTGNAWIYYYNGTPAQRFMIEYVGQGYYKIKAAHSGKVLDIANGSKDSGANVWQYEWNGTDAQLWKFVKTNDGYYIRSKLGTVLDIYSAIYSAGTNVQTYTSNGTAAQKWVLEDEYDSVDIEEGTYQLQTALDPAKVLDIENASGQNCANVQIYTNNNSSAQKFLIEEISDGYYKIESETSGKVLDISNASRSAGANVWQYEWNGSDAQLWRFTEVENGTYYIQSKLGTVLDVSNGLTVSGTNVQAYTLNNSTAQKWILKPIERQLYKIMGESSVTVSQMANFYKDRNTVENQYPYSNVAEAPTIEDFCKIYIEECKIEGVKAEVAFCQAMLETGFLKFGGDVAKEQYNFAGLGATGGGVSGASFNSIREGIRAQVQHLKAYASTEPLNQELVDPRFNYVTRGTAIYVEWLGQKENPNGYGWATSTNYGYNIVDYYITPLLSY